MPRVRRPGLRQGFGEAGYRPRGFGGAGHGLRQGCGEAGHGLRQGFGGASILSACLVAALWVLGSDSAVQGDQASAARQRRPIVRLAPLEAQRLAASARRSVSARIAPGLELTAWAPDGLIIDPLALAFDDRGVLYATSTSRINMPVHARTR